MRFTRFNDKIELPLDIEEAANYLRLSKSTLYKLTAARRIPHYKGPGGKRVYFLASELKQYITSKPISTGAALTTAATDAFLTTQRKKGGRK